MNLAFLALTDAIWFLSVLFKTLLQNISYFWVDSVIIWDLLSLCICPSVSFLYLIYQPTFIKGTLYLSVSSVLCYYSDIINLCLPFVINLFFTASRIFSENWISLCTKIVHKMSIFRIDLFHYIFKNILLAQLIICWDYL